MDAVRWPVDTASSLRLEMPALFGPEDGLVSESDFGLEEGRWLVVKGGVQAAGVVVAVDEGKEFVGCVLLAGKAAIAQHLGLERADEGFGPGVVIGVGSGRHALLHACGAQPLTEEAAAILAATVAVEDDALGAASGGECGVEGLDD